MTRGGIMARVFISHHSGDREMADELHAVLTAARHDVFLDAHVGDGIPAGDQWQHRLEERLRWADAVVCLLTPGFAASQWCAAEVGAARTQDRLVIPLLAEPEVRFPLLDAVQHLDYVQDRPATRDRLLETLRQLDVAGGRGWRDGDSPYPGLGAFDITYHRFFFGRAQEIEDLINLLHEARTPLLLVVGPSGCGKSSLVKAGVAPAIASKPDWEVLSPILPGSSPLEALVGEIVDKAVELGLEWPPKWVRTRLLDGELDDLATELRLKAPRRPRRLLMIIDQLEEVLTQTAAPERAAFGAVLTSVGSTSLRVIATVRSEFVDVLLADPAFNALEKPTVDVVQPLRAHQLATVIARPAELAGLTIDAELVDQMVADTGGGDGLPLLAYTLAEMAKDVPRGGTLTRSRYKELKGVQGALRQRADAALAEATAASGRRTADVLRELLRLVSVDEHGRPTRTRVPRSELSEQGWTELVPFLDRHLVITDSEGERVVVGVAHEAFLSSWQPLKDAIAEKSQALRTRTAVEAAAQEWETDGEKSERLWERGRLAAARADLGARERKTSGRRGMRSLADRELVTETVDLSPRGRAFLQTSTRRDRRRRGRTVAVLSSLLVVALLGAVLAGVAARSAADERDQAVFTKLVAESDQLRDVDVTLSAQLALTAYRMRPDPNLRARVLTLGNGPLSRVLPGIASEVDNVAVSRDGRLAALASVGGNVGLWAFDGAGPRPVGPPLDGHPKDVSAVSLSPDGRLLASGSTDGTRLWSLLDPERPVAIGDPLPGNEVADLEISPDGRTLAVADAAGVQLWSLEGEPAPVGPPLEAPDAGASAVAFTPTGTGILVADGTQVLSWDLIDPTRPAPRPALVTGHGLGITTLAVSPDGRTVATGSQDRSIRLWDATDPNRILGVGIPLQGHTDFVNGLAFSPDGGTLASAGGDRAVRLWTVTDPSAPVAQGPPLTGHSLAVMDVAFRPDAAGGAGLLSVGKDATVRLWDLPSLLLTGRTDYTGLYSNNVVFRPDGRIAAIGNAENGVRLWDTADLRRPIALSTLPPLHSAYVNALAFSPDGRLLATGSGDRTVRLWDLSDPRRPMPIGTPLEGQDKRVFSLAFSPDGRTLAAGSAGGVMRFWDVADPGRPTARAAWSAHSSSVNAIAFTPTGLVATASGDYTTRLWALHTPDQPEPRADVKGHTLFVNAAGITPDGQTLVTASADQTVRLVDLRDPDHPRELAALSDATNPLFASSVAPDGRTVAAGGSDRSVWLWDIGNPAAASLIGPLVAATDTINGMAFDPSGGVLLAASWDQTARVWDLDDERVAQRICESAGGPLDRAQWERWVSPDVDYDPPCRRPGPAS